MCVPQSLLKVNNMAIFGTAATLEKQACSKTFGKVFEFLKNTDLAAVFAEVSVGNKKTIEIDGKNVYVIFQEYDTKLHENAKLEGHRQYADVQYIFEGEEIIGMCDIADVEGDYEYNEEKDIFFCKSKKLSHVILGKGEAAILMPEDLHAPCMCIGEPKRAKKIVFKVKL